MNTDLIFGEWEAGSEKGIPEEGAGGRVYESPRGRAAKMEASSLSRLSPQVVQRVDPSKHVSPLEETLKSPGVTGQTRI